jgi:hypothetical protein
MSGFWVSGGSAIPTFAVVENRFQCEEHSLPDQKMPARAGVLNRARRPKMETPIVARRLHAVPLGTAQVSNQGEEGPERSSCEGHN